MATRDELTEAMRNALSKGNKPLARAIGNKITNKEYDEEVSDLASAGLGIAQGATFGFSDEMYAGWRGALDSWLNDTPFKQAYEQRLQEARDLHETARREDPWSMGLGEVAGGLVTGGAGAMRSLAGQGLKQVMKRAGTAGVGVGALAGYGYGEGDVIKAALMGEEGEFIGEGLEALEDAAKGGAIGGALGATMPALGMGARSIARFGYNLMPRTKGKRLKEGVRLSVVKAIDDDIASGEVSSFDDMVRRLSEDPTMTIADVGGTQVKRLAEELMHSGTPAGAQFRNFVRTRNVGQWRRMHPRIAEALNEGSEKTFGRAKRKLLNDAKSAGREFYDIAYSQDIDVTPQMQSLMNSPAFAGIEKKAKKLLLQDLANEGFNTKNVDIEEFVGNLGNTQRLDYVIRALDSRIKQLYKNDPQYATKVKEARNKFRDMVFKQNPDLAKARAQWADDMAVNDAMDQGQKIFNEDFEMVGDIMKEMSAGEKVGFRIGVAKALTDRFGNKPYDADITKGVFNIPAKEEAVKAAFGSQRKFDEFAKYISQEQKKFELVRLAGGSDTKQRAAQGEDLGKQMSQLAGYSLGPSAGGGILPSMAGYGLGKAYTSIRDAFGLGPVRRPEMMQNLSDIIGAKDISALSQPMLLNPLLRTGAGKPMGLLTRGAQTAGPFRTEDEYGGI